MFSQKILKNSKWKPTIEIINNTRAKTKSWK